jgi:hypothetical protein
MPSPSLTANVPPRRAILASALTLAAGLIHSAAAVPHFGDDTLLGTSFVLTGWAQIVVAALLLRRPPSRWVAVSGAAIHSAALAALTVSRTVGLPVGHGGTEPMAFPDGMTAALELAALAVLAWWLIRPATVTRHRFTAMAGVAGAWALAFGGSTAAVANLGTSGHAHGDAAAGAHGDDTPGGHASVDAGEVDGADRAASDAADGEMAHVHADRSVHVHEPGRAHGHDDGTVHVHLANARTNDRDAPKTSGGSTIEKESASTADGGHAHAPGQGHG